MNKNSKFNLHFSNVFEFDDGSLLVSAELYTLEEAKKMFTDEIEEHKTWTYWFIPKSEVYQTFVIARYDFEEKQNMWWVDNPKELTNFHKPVWIMDTIKQRNTIALPPTD